MIWLTLILATTGWAEESKIPPKVLYHYGQKKFLLEDEAAGNIPQKAWDDFIMGDAGRYQLRPFRRGLYGGETLEGVETYGDMYVGEPGKIPWFMLIHLKDECRDPKVVDPGMYWGARNAAWLIQNLDSLVNGEASCLKITDNQGGCGLRVDIYQTSMIAFGEGKENSCDKLLQRYLQETNAKVVADEGHSDSWYIRDRNCIEKVEANPGALFRELARMDWSKKARPGASSPGGGHASGLFYTLFQALGEIGADADDQALTQIREKALGSDIDIFDFTWKELTKPRGNQRWIAENVPVLVDAYRRCRELGKLEEFRSAATNFSSLMGTTEARSFQTFPGLIWEERDRLQALCR